MSFKNKVLDMSTEQLLAEELRNALSLLWFIRSQQDASLVCLNFKYLLPSIVVSQKALTS